MTHTHGNDPHLLKRLVPLNTLSDEKLTRLSGHVRFMDLDKGDYLFRQGDTMAHNVYLLSGTVALLLNGKEDDRVAADSDTAKFPLAHQIPRKYSARALNDVRCVFVDHRRLNDLLEGSENKNYQVEELGAEGSEDWMSHLLQSRAFQHLPVANIQRIIMRIEEVPVKARDQVVTQGEKGDYFYIIHQGKAVITMQHQSDATSEKRAVRAKIGPGDSFGEEALLSDSPRNSTVTMTTPGILLRLGKEDFIQLVTRPLAKAISYKEASAKVEEGAMFLDVRTHKEYEAKHIMGSINIESRNIRREASHLARNRQYIIYCGLGDHSASSAYVMTEMGFNVSVLNGGIESVPRDVLVDLTHPEDKSILVTMLKEVKTDEENTDLDSLQQRLESAEAKIKELEDRVRKYKRAKEEWKTERHHLENTLAKMKALLETGNKHRHHDQAKIHRLRQERDELKASLAKVKEADS